MTVETQVSNLGFLLAIMAVTVALVWVFVYFIRKTAIAAGLPSFAKLANVLGGLASGIIVVVGLIGAFGAAGPRLALDPTRAPAPSEIEPTGETPVLIEESDRRGMFDRESRLESEREK